ncbi:MAG TPA: tRNA uridine-5-carboxymethylaminomethyl(34) synthesis enzyme MnmG [bacterium]|nr:tRNA uridine-5-carboxymethylaminomethyl(34) synthesis enzyme MnmG [bacterium]
MVFFDVIIIGGGHAGIEAAVGATNTGAKTLLITMSIDKIGEMSCNPSIGGQAKGQLVREIDLLGGIMGMAADFSSIQYRVLNRRKGPAVQALRAQCDKLLYKNYTQSFLHKIPLLSITQDEVISLKKISGFFELTTKSGTVFTAKAVVITSGTFLNGMVHIGQRSFSSGRLGEPSSIGLSESLANAGHQKIRLKTGTPVRILGSSIDFSKMEIQFGENDYTPFSIRTKDRLINQIPCFLTRTTEKTKEAVMDNLTLSPLYGYHKSIEGTGPRYCPSIEDKFVKFPERESHQIFVEPEGWSKIEYYPNGISTSLPYDVQMKILHSITGFENAVTTRTAYAIEYDAFDPKDLSLTLESHFLPGLFLAGQINGTSGYEEAAAQGLVAGINAAIKSLNKENLFILNRTESYIGVLISDITSQGVDEPYRMFTSRAEFRLSVRDNNVPERLLDKAFSFNLIDKATCFSQKNKIDIINNLIDKINTYIIYPDTLTNANLVAINQSPVSKPCPLSTILRRPGVGRKDLYLICGFTSSVSDEIWSRAEINIKYSGFIDRELEEINKIKTLSDISVPFDFQYESLSGLSNEIKQKLIKKRPSSVSEALSIPGMTPAAVSVLIMHLNKGKND